MTAKDVTVAPKILSGNSVPKEKGYGIYCIYLLEKLSCTPTIKDKEAKFLQELYTVIQQG